MNDIKIIQLSPDDWRVYKEIQLEALKEEPQSFASSHKEWSEFSDERWQERPSNPATNLFIAQDGDRPIGLVGVYTEEKEEGKVPEIWGMYVNNAYRRQGIGKQLLQKALEGIDDIKDVSKVTLMVNSTEEPAVNFYKKHGFEIVGEIDYVLGDGNEYLLYIMERK